MNLLRTTCFERLSREELIVPSPSLSEFTCDCFTTFLYLQRQDLKKKIITLREAATFILHWYSPNKKLYM